MPGPQANPLKVHSRHRGRDRAGAVIVLPSAGCNLPPPKLPAGRTWSAHQRRLWRTLWSSPQATQWDDSHALAVAMLIVHSGAVLAGTAPAWQAAEARQLADRLGLTPQGMFALGWRLEDASGPIAQVLPLPSSATG